MKTKAKAKLNRWVTVRIATDWRNGKTKDQVAVDQRVLLRPSAGKLAKRNVSGVTVGLGRAATDKELAAVIVSRITRGGLRRLIPAPGDEGRPIGRPLVP